MFRAREGGGGGGGKLLSIFIFQLITLLEYTRIDLTLQILFESIIN